MIAAIYDPYLDTLGGGERYAMTFGLALLDMGFEVDIFWDDTKIQEKIEKRFGMHLSKFNFLPNVFSSRNFLGTGFFLKNYHVAFMISDGSIPFMTTKNNILHFQVPFRNTRSMNLANRIKIRRIHNIVCNSHFTKKIIDEEYSTNSKVIYPPVDTLKITPGKKQNIILYVGRFSQLLQNKRHDILIESFKSLIDQGLNDWKLVLAGGSEVGRTEKVDDLRSVSENYPIEIIENPTFPQILNLYKKSKIFWQATGYGIDENKHPERVEHFGISVAEAMSAGCAPVVYPKGGIPEIVDDKINGFNWFIPKELTEITFKLITNPQLTNQISAKAREKAQKFSVSVFKSQVRKLI